MTVQDRVRAAGADADVGATACQEARARLDRAEVLTPNGPLRIPVAAPRPSWSLGIFFAVSYSLDRPSHLHVTADVEVPEC